jgi:hypothetical protein
MTRLLIDYLPSFMQSFRELNKIMETEQKEVDSLWKGCKAVLDNQFIASADEYGIERYEYMLGIVPKTTHSLEDRRFAVLTRMNKQLPYTMRSLKQMLENLCGKDGYSVELDAINYILKVRIALSQRNNYNAVCEMLDDVVPANMIIDVSLMYNQNKKFASFTHEQMKAYTHYQLRNEVEFNVE